MSVNPVPRTAARPEPFARYELDRAYDEMFDAEGGARPHYRTIYERLLDVPLAELRTRQQAADRAFLNQGITFTVYGDNEGTEDTPQTSPKGLRNDRGDAPGRHRPHIVEIGPPEAEFRGGVEAPLMKHQHAQHAGDESRNRHPPETCHHVTRPGRRSRHG